MKYATLLFSLFIMVVCTIPTWGQTSHANDPALDCKTCHTCLEPTAENPCLVECPRQTSRVIPMRLLGPDVVILDELSEVEDLYVPVRFNHNTHAHMASTAEGCESCHHYNENEITPQSCSTCHPTEVLHENLAQPGLKGAYHRQCIGCHMEWDQNTSCVICHEKKAGGPLEGTATTYSKERHYPVIEMRDTIVYKTNFDDNDKVPFHHKTHAYKYDRNCGDCHSNQKCDLCHNQNIDELKPMGDLSAEEMHDHCLRCHGDQDCDHCHGRAVDDVFSHNATGWPLKEYHSMLHCRDCHVQSGDFVAQDTACNQCHVRGWNLSDFDHSTTGVVLGEMHEMGACVDCHGESLKVENGIGFPQTAEFKTNCTSCHEEGFEYDPEVGFPQ